jgi:hypothetical protein
MLNAATESNVSMSIDQDLVDRLDDRVTEAMKKPLKPSKRASNAADPLDVMVIETGFSAHRRPDSAAFFAHSLMHVWFGGPILFVRSKVSAI